MKQCFKKNLDHIIKVNDVIAKNLGIHLTDVCLDNFVNDPNFSIPSINPTGPYSPKIHIDEKENIITFVFHDMFDKVNSTFILKHDNVIMHKVFKNIENLMLVLNACRFKSNEPNMPTLPVLETVQLFFSVIGHIDKDEIYMEVIIRNSLTGYAFTSNKNTVAKGRYLFTKLSLTGDVVSSDLIDTKSKILEAWDIDENTLNIDYKNLGTLTDMVNI